MLDELAVLNQLLQEAMTRGDSNEAERLRREIQEMTG